MTVRSAILGIALAGAMSGCGQKGPLVLPPPMPPPQSHAPPAEEPPARRAPDAVPSTRETR